MDIEQEILRLAGDNVRTVDIGRKLDIPTTNIRYYLRKLGITKNGAGTPITKNPNGARVSETRTKIVALKASGMSYKEVARTVGLSKQRTHAILMMGAPVVGSECASCRITTKKLFRHHEDYSKPDSVVWLCASCHMTREWDLRHNWGVK